MFVKPPCERLLVPQYHLADRSTQTKNKSMKWHPEEGRHWKASWSSIDWQDKERKWLILLYTSSIEVIHILSKSPIVHLTCSENVKQFSRTMCFRKKERWSEQDEQHDRHHQRKAWDIQWTNVKTIRLLFFIRAAKCCKGPYYNCVHL